MGKTFLNLRQLIGKALTIGSTAAGDNGLLTIEKGTGAVTQIGLDVKSSATIAGDLNLIGDLNMTGAVNQSNVTNLAVKDKTVTLNKAGTVGLASGAGIDIEGGGAVVGAIRYDSALTNKFSVGDGTTQTEIATVAQITTLTNRYFRAVTVSGTQDGTNKVFSIPSSVLVGSEQVFVNGQLLTPGSTNDYVIAGTSITLQAAMDAPLAADTVRVYGVV